MVKIEDILLPPRLLRVVIAPSAGPPGPGAGEQPLPGAVIGQLFQAKVLGPTPSGEILLEINGERLTAEAQGPLPENETIWLEVRQTKPMLCLAPAARKGAAQELLKHFLSGNSAISQATAELTGTEDERFAGLRAFFDQTGIDDSEPLRRLLRLIAESAGSGAAKSQGPAAALKELVAMLTTEAIGGSERRPQVSVGYGLEKLAQLVDASQAVNGQPPSPSPPCTYIFPCWLANAEGWGAWSFTGEEGGEEGQGGHGYALNFFLFLTRLGDLQFSVLFQGL